MILIYVDTRPTRFIGQRSRFHSSDLIESSRLQSTKIASGIIDFRTIFRNSRPAFELPSERNASLVAFWIALIQYVDRLWILLSYSITFDKQWLNIRALYF